MPITVLYEGENFGRERWIAALKEHGGHLDLRIAPEIGEPAEIDYVIVGSTSFTPLGTYPNLKAVLSAWAGVNHLLADDSLARDIPIVRMSDLSLRAGMVEYVTYHVLRYHLRARDYERQQAAGIWRELDAPMAPQRTVGVLGLGALGQEVAAALAALRFRVVGWSRTRKALTGVQSFAGREDLPNFLARAEILVCLLPLTEETRGILDAEAFAHMPRGAAVINAARGPHIVDDDLLTALATRHIAGATLDVFETEPLPGDHPYWTNPNVTITPHMASHTRASTGVPFLIETIARIERGETPETTVDRSAGY